MMFISYQWDWQLSPSYHYAVVQISQDLGHEFWAYSLAYTAFIHLLAHSLSLCRKV